MRCKQGDLAIYVGPVQKSIGFIVRCIKTNPFFRDAWVVDPPLFYENGEPAHSGFDRNLRPIRDQDGQDETLTWLDVPSKGTTCVK